MNYSHYNIVRKQKYLKSPARRLYSMLRIWMMRIALVTLVFVIIAGCTSVYGAYQGAVSTSPNIDGIDVHPELFSSKVFFNDGSEMVELVGAGTNKIYAPIDTIPQKIRDTFVAMEDERFYQHHGIDVRGIFRAAFSVVKVRGLKYGASTITQQLLKNQVFGGGNERSSVDKLVRKVQEQYLAVQLEDKLDKDSILEYYLNSINLGNGSTGIGDAANRYFGKEVGELTISEAAVIAPIAYWPNGMNPLLSETAEKNNRRRREDCLNNMLNCGFCTQEEYDEAIADTDDVYIRLAQHAETVGAYNQQQYSYFVDELIEQLVTDLQKKGYDEAKAYNLLYTGGLRIHTTQDKQVQDILDSYFTDEENFPKIGSGSYYELAKTYALSFVSKDGKISKHYHLNDLLKYYANFKDSSKLFYHAKDTGNKGINAYTTNIDKFKEMIDEFVADKAKAFEEDNGLGPDDYNTTESRTFSIQPQCAMVIMDHTTGNVVAQYGGRGEKVGNRVLNRASNTFRQAGSTFKVLASFLPAMDLCGYTLASVFDDCYFVYPNTEQAVKSWYGYFKGLSTIRQGIYDSRNVVACQCMLAITPELGVQTLLKLGFSKIDTDGSDGLADYNVSIALGGLTNGCSVLEMTAGYAAIANKGMYCKPRYYSRVYDHDGNILLDNGVESKQVMKPATAYLLTSALVDTTVIGTGTSSKFRKDVEHIPVAGKTGTAHDNIDLWFAGFTPYYTAAIWSGYDNNLGQTNNMYYRYMWRNIMEDVHRAKGYGYDADGNKTVVEFERPANIVEADICIKCGKLAVPGLCDEYAGGNCIKKKELFENGTVPFETCTCHERVEICDESGQRAGPYCTSTHTKVYLKKAETAESREHGGTSDTPYIISSSAQETCTIHTSAPVIPPDDGGETPGGGGTPDGGATTN